MSSARSSIDLTELEELLSGRYYFYAPYLAEDHSECEDPITITWYNGTDTTGVTQGIISGHESSRLPTLVSVTDEYAQQNPTLVIMYGDDIAPKEVADNTGIATNNGSTSGSTSGGSTVNYTPRDIDCRDLNDDDILELRMPQFRLTKHTRKWPEDSKIDFYIIKGDYELDSEGIATNLSVNENDAYLFNFRLSRRDIDRGRWKVAPASFLIHNWRSRQSEFRFVVTFKQWYTNPKVKISGKVGIDADGNYESDQQISYVIEQDKARLLFNVPFDRCSTLGSITSDTGFGTRNGARIYNFNGLEFYFEVDPR